MAAPVESDAPAVAKSDEHRALTRRIDLWLLAPLTFLYFLCYLDRANLSNAKADISSSLHLTKEQYGLASSLFQVGYIACEVPANMVLKISRPSKWLGFLVMAFGMMAVATIFCKNFAELAAVRVFLGVAEAGFPPGCLYVLSMWYRKDELGRRNTLFLVAGPLGARFAPCVPSRCHTSPCTGIPRSCLLCLAANATGGIIAYGVLQVL
jgi:sugar phosphate permease